MTSAYPIKLFLSTGGVIVFLYFLHVTIAIVSVIAKIPTPKKYTIVQPTNESLISSSLKGHILSFVRNSLGVSDVPSP